MPFTDPNLKYTKSKSTEAALGRLQAFIFVKDQFSKIFKNTPYFLYVTNSICLYFFKSLYTLYSTAV